MTHAYFTNLVTNTRMTYRIQSAGTSFIITGTPDWDSVKSELVKDFLGDWSKYWWTFVSLVCVICAADWILKIFGFLSERYLGNGRLGRLLGLGKARPKSETPVIEPPTVTSTRTESPNHTPGDPTGWPPSVSNFEQTPRIPSFDPRRVRINMISLYPVGSQSWGTGYAPRWIKSPTVTGYVNSVPCSILIDTGAGLSMAPTAIGLALPITMEATDAEMIDISGNKIPVDARTWVHIRIGEFTRTTWLYLSSSLSISDDIILGIDTLRTFPSIELDLANSRLTFKSASIQMVPGTSCLTRSGSVQFRTTWDNAINLKTIFIRDKGSRFSSIICATIDSQIIKCLVDTGATVTVAPLSLAR
jgi:hypothetical protein